MNDVFKTLSSTTVDEIADYAIGQDNQFRKHAGLELLLSIWKRERLEAAVNSDWYKDLGDTPLTSQPMEFVDSDDVLNENNICPFTGKKLYYVYERHTDGTFSHRLLTAKNLKEKYGVSQNNLMYHIKVGTGFTQNVFVSTVMLDLTDAGTRAMLNSGFDSLIVVEKRKRSKIEIYHKRNPLCCIKVVNTVKEAALFTGVTFNYLSSRFSTALNMNDTIHAKDFLFKWTSQDIKL